MMGGGNPSNKAKILAALKLSITKQFMSTTSSDENNHKKRLQKIEQERKDYLETLDQSEKAVKKLSAFIKTEKSREKMSFDK